MYSFTLKPEEDTPEALRAYAEAHGVGPGWLFLTGSPADLELVRRKFGFVDPDPAVDADRSSHVGMVLFGDVAHEQWAGCPCLSNPRVMLEQILWMMPEEKRPFIGVEPRAPAEISQPRRGTGPRGAVVDDDQRARNPCGHHGLELRGKRALGRRRRRRRRRERQDDARPHGRASRRPRVLRLHGRVAKSSVSRTREEPTGSYPRKRRGTLTRLRRTA